MVRPYQSVELMSRYFFKLKWLFDQKVLEELISISENIEGNVLRVLNFYFFSEVHQERK